LDALSLIGSRNIATHTTRAVTPIVVQEHLARGRNLFKLERYAVFMIDSGLVTCIDASKRRVKWRTQTDSSFADLRQAAAEEVSMGLHSEEEKLTRLRKYPHLARYSLHQHDAMIHSTTQRYRGTDPYVMAVGEEKLTAINARSGDIVDEITLDQAPVAPAIVDDFNGDGTNDIIIVTANTIYGYVVASHSATSTIAVVMILMVGLLALLFLTREMSIRDGGCEGAGDAELPTTAPLAKTRPRTVKRSTD
jgi:hypothetical protein